MARSTILLQQVMAFQPLLRSRNRSPVPPGLVARNGGAAGSAHSTPPHRRRKRTGDAGVTVPPSAERSNSDGVERGHATGTGPRHGCRRRGRLRLPLQTARATVAVARRQRPDQDITVFHRKLSRKPIRVWPIATKRPSREAARIASRRAHAHPSRPGAAHDSSPHDSPALNLALSAAIAAACDRLGGSLSRDDPHVHEDVGQVNRFSSACCRRRPPRPLVPIKKTVQVAQADTPRPRNAVSDSRPR